MVFSSFIDDLSGAVKGCPRTLHPMTAVLEHLGAIILRPGVHRSLLGCLCVVPEIHLLILFF